MGALKNLPLRGLRVLNDMKKRMHIPTRIETVDQLIDEIPVDLKTGFLNIDLYELKTRMEILLKCKMEAALV